MSFQDGIFFLAHLLHSPFCEGCRDEVDIEWRRFLIKLKWGYAKKEKEK